MIQSSKKADRTKNPIRNIVDNLKPPVNHPKPFLNLALGDPTLYGNLKCPDVLQKALLECLMSNKCDGYFPSIGSVAAREAIAERASLIANKAISRIQETSNHHSTNNHHSKIFHTSKSSNLTDSFSYENKNSSDTCDYYEDRNFESPSLDSGHLCDESSEASQLTSSNLNKENADEVRGLHLRLSNANISAQQDNNFTRTGGDSRKYNLDSLPSSIQISGNDVIIASGCSGAVEMAISVLMNEGDNILVPRPGFPLYQVVTESLGGHVRQYPLKPEHDWECDTIAMEEMIDSRTKAILINNPSNPCGSSYSVEHLLSIIDVARRHSLPIIADEIYGGCVFDLDTSFTPLCCLCDDVPILSLGGLAKEFVVPGWRVGWVTIHDTYACPPSASISTSITASTTTSTLSARMILQSKEGSSRNSGNESFKDSFFNNNSTHCSYKDGDNNESTSTEKKNEKIELNGNVCKLNYIGKQSEHANCNIMNGKNAYYDYRNNDIRVVNEKIRRALVEKKIQNDISNLSDDKVEENGNEVICKIKKDWKEDISDRNKINLRGYHMNGTVDIDELLISYINQTSQNGPTTYTSLNQDVSHEGNHNLNYYYNSNHYNNNNDNNNNNNYNNNKDKNNGNNNAYVKNNHTDNLHHVQHENKNNSTSNLLPVSRLSDVRVGLRNLTQLTLGASSLLQSALPRVLTPASDSEDEKSLSLFRDKYMHTLRKNTQICVNSLLNVSELKTNAPKGAMYIMLQIDISKLFDIKDDKEFAEKLLTEENLSVLPGACFNMGGYIRLVTCPPEEIFTEAVERLKLFCSRHNIVNQSMAMAVTDI